MDFSNSINFMLKTVKRNIVRKPISILRSGDLQSVMYGMSATVECGYDVTFGTMRLCLPLDIFDDMDLQY